MRPLNWVPYNPGMLQGLNLLLGGAAIERATLLANHVLTSEPVATRRLMAHSGRRVELHFSGWPAVLPRLPNASFLITPAGLLEWCGEEGVAPADLRVVIEASNPALALAQALSGARPKVEVAGDAALAADLNWIFDNVRWDVQDDLARLVGPAPAREIARIAGGVAGGLQVAVRTLHGLVTRDRGAASAAPR